MNPSGNGATAQATAPKVSVVIPAFNAGAFIGEALASVLAQAYQPMEIILVDDGSTDDTVAIARKAAPDVTVISQENAGVAAARNTGMRHATGTYLCFLDADDGWFPGKLAAQVQHLEQHPDVGMVYHNWLVWQPDAHGRYAPLTPPAPPAGPSLDHDASGWIYHQLLLDCVVHTSTVMLRRSIATQAGQFNGALRIGEDYDYWLRVSRLARIDKLTQVFSFYRGTVGDSLTARVRDEDFEYRVIQQALDTWGPTSPDGQGLTAAQVRRRLAGLATGFGYLHYRRGSNRIARQAFWRAMKHRPLAPRNALLLVSTLWRQLFGGGERNT